MNGHFQWLWNKLPESIWHQTCDTWGGSCLIMIPSLKLYIGVERTHHISLSCSATADVPLARNGGFPPSLPRNRLCIIIYHMSMTCVDPFIHVHRSGPFERMRMKKCYEGCSDIEMHFSIVLRSYILRHTKAWKPDESCNCIP